MIKIELLRDKGIAVVSPQGPLEVEDFRGIARVVDPFIAEKGKLSGVLVDAPTFPGWESFAALIEHMKFVHNHHRSVDRLAAVSDSAFLRVAPRIAEHLAHPEIKVFNAGEKDRALKWLETGS
jgi:hypothetical protein